MPVEYSNIGLLIDGQLSLDEWAATGFAISQMTKSITWWLGDWIVYGESLYGEKSAQFIDAEQFQPDQVRYARWVATEFPPSRRRYEVGVSYYAAVRTLPEPQQDELLEAASQHVISRDELRQAVRKLQGTSSDVAKPPASPPVEAPMPSPFHDAHPESEPPRGEMWELIEWIHGHGYIDEQIAKVLLDLPWPQIMSEYKRSTI